MKHYGYHFHNVLSPISSFLLRQETDPDKVGNSTLPFHFHLANAVSELLDPQDTESAQYDCVLIFCRLDLPMTERVLESSCQRAYMLRIVLSS